MTIQETQEEIISEFKGFNDWVDRYKYVIKLGKKLPLIDLEYKKEENLIKDCQVKTWFKAVFEDGKMFYYIDSQSTIIRGIVSLLIRTLSGQKPEDIKNNDLYFIGKICPWEDFSSLRVNNLQKLIDKMKTEADLYLKN